MKPASFTYYRPTSLAEMLDLLGDYGEEGKVLAGGQSLVAAMNFRLVRPRLLFDANELNELAYLQESDGELRIGAMSRHAAFHRPVVEGAMGELLCKVVSHIGHYPIRQRGTFGGSLAHCDPASEWCLVSATLDAKIVARNRQRERIIEAADFFRGIFTTDLKADELLTEIRLPLLGPEWRGGFYEFSRRAGDFALAMSLAALRIVDGRILDARLGLGGVGDRALRLKELEQQLIGHAPSQSLFFGVALSARDLVKPMADIHGSAEYRRDLIGVVVTRALTQAAS